MEEFSTGISILVGVIAICTAIFVPLFKLNHDYKHNKEFLANDFEALQQLKEMANDDKMILLMILNHIIDGNNIEKIKETRNSLIKMITEERNWESATKHMIY